MATAQTIVTRAYRRLGLIDIHEQPTAAEMDNGLAALVEMLNSWQQNGILAETLTMDGTITDGEDGVTDMLSTAKLSLAINVSGTGIPSDTIVQTIVSDTSIQLSKDATASGTVSLTFTLFPIHEKHDKAIIALLAIYMAGDGGMPDAPPRVLQDAEDGWAGILADYLETPNTTYDNGLRYTQVTNPSVIGSINDTLF